MASTVTTAKVLHVITELSIGGAQTALLRLLGQLDRRTFVPVVACLYNGDGAIARQLRVMGIPVSDLNMTSKTRLDALWRLERLLRRERPDILHTWMFHANIPGRLAGCLTRVPIVISAERTMGQEGWWRRWLNRATAPLADRVVCVSQPVADFAVRSIGLPAAKLVVIPNGIDLAEFAHLPDRAVARAAVGLPADAVVIGAIGRPRPVKGFDVLLEAFARLAPAHPHARLAFVGDGPDKERLRDQAARSNLTARVTFLEDRLDVPRILPGLDVLAVPSLHEGMPNVVLEAMAAGLPVVATAVGGTTEIVIDGLTGFLVPPRDPDALARAIEVLIADGDRARAMGQAGRKRIASRFSQSRTTASTESLYAELLARR